VTVEAEVSPRTVRASAAGVVAEAERGAETNEPMEYVGLVTRLIAITVDALVIDVTALAVSGAVLLVLSLFSITAHNHPIAIAVGGVLYVVWVVSYFGVFWTMTGQTLGSRVMQVRVTRPDGSRLRPRHALLRLAGVVISLPLFWGYLPVLTNSRRRGIPDMIGGTVVTEARTSPQSGAGRVASDLVLQRRVVAMLAARDPDLRREQ
jgi:uncharacterized RDD family membrane protein YckC